MAPPSCGLEVVQASPLSLEMQESMEVVPAPPLSLEMQDSRAADLILVTQHNHRKRAGLEVVSAPPLSLELQKSKAAAKAVMPQQDYSKTRALPRFWKWYGLLCSLLVLLLIGAVVGTAVEGTRNRSDVASSLSTSAHPSTFQSNTFTSTSNPTSSPSDVVNFASVYHVDSKPAGIGPDAPPSDLLSSNDLSFPFDYEHSGRLDHMVIYQPGAGAIAIFKNDNGTFTSVYPQGDSDNGIGNFGLLDNGTLAFAFDFEHSGNLDYLVFYVPGSRTISILKNVDGNFSAVFREGSPANGIGGYDLLYTEDRAFAFDYDHSGKLDHIALYRPGTGIIWILANDNGTFSPVYQSYSGIGGYGLASPADHALAFDYDHSGKMDYIILYSYETGATSIVEHGAGKNNFTAVYQDPNSGVGGFGIRRPADFAFAYDYASTGRQDYLVFCRPGEGIIWVLENNNGTFTSIYGETNPGEGIGGYTLDSPADLAYAFDYEQSGNLDHIVLYHPGAGIIFIVGKAKAYIRE